MQVVLFGLILIPLLGAILNGLVLRSKHTRVAGGIATACSAACFLLALSLSLNYFETGTPLSAALPWMSAGPFVLNWGLRFDALTLVMTLVITGIGTLIHLFSIGYMDEEKSPYRYFAYLNLFLSAMLLLVLGDSLPVLFVGWEGVGLCSYLLIGYWYEDIDKANAGMKAFVMNRIGDAAFLLGVFICYQQFKSVTFTEMAHLTATSNSLSVWWLEMAALCLFVGATGKSAQIPLFTWLPDAMAGPTPVSALIHAATMVTAGIYLVARTAFLFQVSPDVSQWMAYTGAFTALFAATIALVQKDIKKILAYSTVSQLGLMFVALGVGAYSAALFHVMTHAFFKALLFLAAGAIIHGLHGEQDIFKMGGLRKHFPLTFLFSSIAVAAICGLPPFSGFFSKDAILFAALASPTGDVLLWGVASLASLLTAFYMTRFYLLIFFGDYRGEAHPHEGSALLWIPLAVLAVGSAFAGLVGMPHGLHMLPDYFGQLLSPVLPAWQETHAFLGEIGAMSVAVAVAALGIGTAFVIYRKGTGTGEKLARAFSPLYKLLLGKWYIDELYELTIVLPFKALCRFSSRIIDRAIDVTVLFPARLARVGGTALSLVQVGAVQVHLWIMVLGGLVLLWWALRGLVV